MSHDVRISTGRHGEPVLTVTVTGSYDIARFASGAMCAGQCEFADSGHKVLDRLKARMGSASWDRLHEMLYGRDHVCGQTRCVGRRSHGRSRPAVSA